MDIFGKINPTPIALLFGLMLVNAYLKAGEVNSSLVLKRDPNWLWFPFTTAQKSTIPAFEVSARGRFHIVPLAHQYSVSL